MAQHARVQAVLENTSRQARNVAWPLKQDGRHQYISEIYNSQVFTFRKLQEALPKTVYARFIQQIKVLCLTQGRQALDKATADAIAHAVRIWAMDNGATHFTHWFQPQTGTTAEKHDSFLTLKTTIVNGVEETTAIDAFSGSQLLQAEPDASSFPNGGTRTTFEARGYTIWDTTAPMFLRNGPHGTSVLYIPSVFISYNGDALDEKTILLRSSETLSTAAVKLLNLLGDKETKRVYSTLGTEQEFFLIDRNIYNLRPDLKICGRTLVGTIPPKHQQLEDHYFGQMPSRVLATLSETELELYKLGAPVKTRHNEVAPNQFEMAPIFEEASVAVDHNLVLMETLHQVAHRHKLKVLYHEKPFKGVNGSGKHCNWSMSTDSGDNLLEPTVKPETNYRFLLMLVATLDGLQKHGGLLRASIASASNEHRLGAQEAPPGIISAFLGEHLSEVLDAVEQSREVKNFSQPHLTTVKVGGTVLDVKVNTLPQIARDLTDRNRTSPFAFTGNKFEFRAVGSKQSPSFPVVLINAAVAASINAITLALEKQKGTKALPSEEDILSVIRGVIKSSKAVRFEGNNYSDEWKAEAEKRGLPNIKSAPEAFKQLINPKHSSLLTSLGIMTETEVNARYHILCEKYAKDLVIEAGTLKGMVQQSILPACFAYRKELADTLSSLKSVGIDVSTTAEKTILERLGPQVSALLQALDGLTKGLDEMHSVDESEQAVYANAVLVPGMDAVRSVADVLEGCVADKHWPFPKYLELLF